MTSKTSSHYPKPGPVGGVLIRKVCRLLKGKTKDSHILIAVSGGSDSTALAILLAKYGKQITAKNNISFLHINHGLRGRAADGDEEFVRGLSKRLGVKFYGKKIKLPIAKGESLENQARNARKNIYRKFVTTNQKKYKGRAVIFTAHHGDDLIETLLWRLFTGTSQVEGGGILFQEGFELRPFLGVTRQEILAFLKEEGASWREDRMNTDSRYLRARLRNELTPVLERLFPRYREHIIKAALEMQVRSEKSTQKPPQKPDDTEIFRIFFQMAGVRPRRAHWEMLEHQLSKKTNQLTQLHLPGGWRMLRGKSKRWILEPNIRPLMGPLKEI